MAKLDSETHINIAEAKARLSELVQRAMRGEELVIAKDNRPVARLVAYRQPGKLRRPGSGKGKIWVERDFEAPFEDFRDYR